VDPSALPATLGAGQKAKIVLNVSATIDADLANFATLQITTAEGVTRTFDVSIALLPALPTIQTEPSFVEAGVAPGRSSPGASGSGTSASPRSRTSCWMRRRRRGSRWASAVAARDPGRRLRRRAGHLRAPRGLTPAIVMDKFVIRSSNHVAYTETLVAIVTSSTTGDATFEVRNTENVLLPGASV